MIPTRSASWSASSRYWVVRKTVVPSSVELHDLLPDRLAADRVEAGGRLVEEQHPRLVDERRGEVEPAPHPARVGADAAVGGLLEADAVEQRVAAALGPRRRAARGGSPAAGSARGRSSAGRAPPPGARPRSRGGPRRASATTSWPATLALPAGRAQQRGQHPHGGRLAGAVGAEEGVDLALGDLEVDPATALIPPSKARSSPVTSIAGTARESTVGGATRPKLWARRDRNPRRRQCYQTVRMAARAHSAARVSLPLLRARRSLLAAIAGAGRCRAARRRSARPTRTPDPSCPPTTVPGDRQRHRVPARGRRQAGPVQGHRGRQDRRLGDRPLASRTRTSASSSASSSSRDVRHGADGRHRRDQAHGGKKYRLKRDSPIVSLGSELGEHQTFTLANPLQISKGDILALTLPTWASNFAAASTAPRTSSAPAAARASAPATRTSRTAARTAGRLERVYGCDYRLAAALLGLLRPD